MGHKLARKGTHESKKPFTSAGRSIKFITKPTLSFRSIMKHCVTMVEVESTHSSWFDYFGGGLSLAVLFSIRT